MKSMLLMCAILPLAFAAAAKDPDCSTPVKRKLDARDYERLAKVSPEQARKAATDQAGGAQAQVTRGGLETEHGCLVYKYNVQAPGKSGVEEVVVDAGDGRILSAKHESAIREKVEKALDPKENLNKAR